MEWFVYSICSMLLFSAATAFYKLPSYKNQSRLATTFWMMSFIFLWSLLAFNHLIFAVNKEVIFFALLWGAGFGSLTAIQIYLLSRLEINTLFPINTLLSMIFVIAFGLFVFMDKIYLIQGLGIIVAIIALYLFILNNKKVGYSKSTLKFGIAMVSLSVFTKVIQKTAVDNVSDIKVLIIYQFLFALLFLLLANIIYYRQKWQKKILSSSYKSGLMISIPSFFGNLSIIYALSKGPFSLIYSIHTFYIFGGAILGYFFFQEQLTRKKLALLGLAIIAIVLIRIG